jgi:uracil phosphoribosyltransferase
MSLTIVDHPLVHDRLATLRAKDANHVVFRSAVHQLAQMVTFSATAQWETRVQKVVTPLTVMSGRELARPVIVVPILRAGLGMLQGVLELLPEATVGHIGLARCEETHRPQKYYARFPKHLAAAEVLLVDPMLATGHSAIAAVKQLREAGAERISFLCLIAAPEGIACFQAACPEVPLFAAAMDDGLTAQAFITPGLGDAGDRYFGTI